MHILPPPNFDLEVYQENCNKHFYWQIEEKMFEKRITVTVDNWNERFKCTENFILLNLLIIKSENNVSFEVIGRQFSLNYLWHESK